MEREVHGHIRLSQCGNNILPHIMRGTELRARVLRHGLLHSLPHAAGNTGNKYLHHISPGG